MKRISNWLVRHLVFRIVTLSLGVGIIVAIAGLIEGRHLDLVTVGLAALPIATAFAVAWTLSSWRTQGGDSALATGGISPWRLFVVAAVLTTPLFALPGLSAKTQTSYLEIKPERIVVVLGDQETTYLWQGQAAQRQTPGHPPEVSTLPPPQSVDATAKAPSLVLVSAVRTIPLLTLIGWLVFRIQQPRTASVLISATLCIACADGLPWLLT